MIKKLYDFLLQAFAPLEVIEIACLIYIVKNLISLFSWLLNHFKGGDN